MMNETMTPLEKARNFLEIFEKILVRCYKPDLEVHLCATEAVENIRKHAQDPEYWHSVWVELQNIRQGLR